MTWNWKYFLCAAFVCGAALFKAGAPLFAIVLGLVFGAWMTGRAMRSA